MKHRCSVVLGVVAVALFAVSQCYADITLGTAADFGLLGGAGVTNTGGSIVINGDVGSAPAPAVTGFPPGVVIGGTLYLAPDGATAQAHQDLQVAYIAAMGAPGLPGPADLGGVTLYPGVYTWGTTAAWTAGDLTLDGLGDPNAEWIFQIGTALTTPADAHVVLANGADPNHVFWALGTSATIGGNNLFAGTLMADQSISLNGGTLTGRALAINALVSITTDQIVNVPQPIPEPSTCVLFLGGFAGVVLRRRRGK